jgi:hypothetical protein
MDAAHLTRCVAQHGGTTAGSGAETSPQFPIDHESLQRISQRRRITWGREDAARRIDDLARATDAAGHDWQTGLKPFDEREPERLGRGVRLAEEIGGGQQRRHICSLAEEAHAIFDASVTRDRFELVPVGHLRWTLRATNNPTGPSVERAQFGQRLEEHVLPLPRLEAADLHDDDVRLRCADRLSRRGALTFSD